MTTGNKIIVTTVKDAIYVPIECVQAGADSIPFVYTKKGTKQIVLLGDSNEKKVFFSWAPHELSPSDFHKRF